MNLCNLHIVGAERGPVDIQIAQGKIQSITPHKELANGSIIFNDGLVFPGLVNSHDHLEFNLFPQLKSKTYQDYKEWGTDIHLKFGDEIERILQVPKNLRVQWGMLKNLLSGVTTVIDHTKNNVPHNPWIDVYRDYRYLHSIGLERFWKVKLNNPFSKSPLIVHLGEGVTKSMSNEIDDIIKWNRFQSKVIGVHGIAMNESQAKHFEAIVWCPDSNLFLYNKTATVNELKKHTSILFGTDSTLSASWNIWEQLKVAHKLKFLNDQELFDSLTMNPSNIFDLNLGLRENCSADLVITKKKYDDDSWDNFYSINPENILLIIKCGEIRLFDSSIKDQINVSILDLFAPIQYENSKKYIGKEAIQIIKEINKYEIELPLPITVNE